MDMYELQRLAMVIGNAAGGLIEALGMVAANQERLANGHTIAYDERTFHNLIDQRGLGYNDLIGQVYGR